MQATEGTQSIQGFCLSRLEVLNWGTFHKHVWALPIHGQNALLTGDIGSGKSTLVDAITALLVPPRRIIFNKAAGAEGRERSLKSYIRGEFKSLQTEQMNARAESLRDDHGYSVILAQFYHAGRDEVVTLAQVLWVSEGSHAQFFLVADHSLSIAEAFSGQDGTVADLKKLLKRTAGIEVFENFKPYGTSFRKHMGIRHEKALDLFNQTISMKSVGNLTSFVREHMLEPGRLMDRVETLKRDFDNLNQAHNAVLKARKQIEILSPLANLASEYAALQKAIADLTHCRDGLEAWIADQKIGLLQQRQHKLEAQQRRESARLETLQQALNELRLRESQLRQNIDDQGGRRLAELARDIERLQQERQRKQGEAQHYQQAVQILSMSMPNDAESFHHNRETSLSLSEQLQNEESSLDEQRDQATIAMHEIQQQCQALEQEITSLKQRKNNIPYKSLQIRALMTQALGLDDNALPFVGELVQVNASASTWEGSIERLLHNFALSMLVPDSLYEQVSSYVESTHLRGRLVYYRVQDRHHTINEAEPASILSKLAIKQDSSFRRWLQHEIYKRFPHICCDSMQTFRRHPFALSKAGQIKSGGTRHEKDDRNKLFDRSRFILGWSNQAKIETLTQNLSGLEQSGREHVDQLSLFSEKKGVINNKKLATRDILRIDQLDEIDWQAVAKLVQVLQEEKQYIEAGSDILKALQAQLLQNQSDIETKDKQRGDCKELQGSLKKDLEHVQEQSISAQQSLQQVDEVYRDTWFPHIAKHSKQVLAARQLSLRSLDQQQSEIRQAIQAQINQQTQKQERRANKLMAGMSDFKHAFAAESNELDSTLAAWPEYAAILAALQRDDLPKHEKRFREMLHEGTIQGIVLLRTQLEKEQQGIRTKIADINRSLHDIEYNAGSYIELQAEHVNDNDIREFEAELRQCVAGALDADALYTEKRFLQVKGLVDHFNDDPRWAQRVTNVRNWFNFSAIERWQEDDSQKEFYSDSSGKSGGQKEKLAYTILASSLAYQFGATQADSKTRSFRFVVIDEAFGKGSDDSTHYALALFAKLGLQLLVVTPMQKIHVITHYVQSVHLVHNEEGRNSVVRSVSIEQFRKDKAALHG